MLSQRVSQCQYLVCKQQPNLSSGMAKQMNFSGSGGGPCIFFVPDISALHAAEAKDLQDAATKAAICVHFAQLAKSGSVKASYDYVAGNSVVCMSDKHTVYQKAMRGFKLPHEVISEMLSTLRRAAKKDDKNKKSWVKPEECTTLELLRCLDQRLENSTYGSWPTAETGGQESAWVVVLGTLPRGDVPPAQQESQEHDLEQQEMRAVQERLAGRVHHLVWVECDPAQAGTLSRATELLEGVCMSQPHEPPTPEVQQYALFLNRLRGACATAPAVPHPVEPSALLPLRRFVAMSREQLVEFLDAVNLLFEGSAVWGKTRPWCGFLDQEVEKFVEAGPSNLLKHLCEHTSTHHQHDWQAMGEQQHQQVAHLRQAGGVAGGGMLAERTAAGGGSSGTAGGSQQGRQQTVNPSTQGAQAGGGSTGGKENLKPAKVAGASTASSSGAGGQKPGQAAAGQARKAPGVKTGLPPAAPAGAGGLQHRRQALVDAARKPAQPAAKAPGAALTKPGSSKVTQPGASGATRAPAKGGPGTSKPGASAAAGNAPASQPAGAARGPQQQQGVESQQGGPAVEDGDCHADAMMVDGEQPATAAQKGGPECVGVEGGEEEEGAAVQEEALVPLDSGANARALLKAFDEALLAQDKAVAAAVGPIQKKRRLTGDKQKDAAIREANRGIRAGMPKDPVDPALFQAASISGQVKGPVEALVRGLLSCTSSQVTLAEDLTEHQQRDLLLQQRRAGRAVKRRAGGGGGGGSDGEEGAGNEDITRQSRVKALVDSRVVDRTPAEVLAEMEAYDDSEATQVTPSSVWELLKCRYFESTDDIDYRTTGNKPLRVFRLMRRAILLCHTMQLLPGCFRKGDPWEGGVRQVIHACDAYMHERPVVLGTLSGSDLDPPGANFNADILPLFGTSPVLQGIMEEVAKRYSGESNVPYDVMEEARYQEEKERLKDAIDRKLAAQAKQQAGNSSASSHPPEPSPFGPPTAGVANGDGPPPARPRKKPRTEYHYPTIEVEGMYDLEEKKAQDKWEQERRASALEAAAAAGRPSISGATGAGPTNSAGNSMSRLVRQGRALSGGGVPGGALGGGGGAGGAARGGAGLQRAGSTNGQVRLGEADSRPAGFDMRKLTQTLRPELSKGLGSRPITSLNAAAVAAGVAPAPGAAPGGHAVKLSTAAGTAGAAAAAGGHLGHYNKAQHVGGAAGGAAGAKAKAAAAKGAQKGKVSSKVPAAGTSAAVEPIGGGTKPAAKAAAQKHPVAATLPPAVAAAVGLAPITDAGVTRTPSDNNAQGGGDPGSGNVLKVRKALAFDNMDESPADVVLAATPLENYEPQQAWRVAAGLASGAFRDASAPAAAAAAAAALGPAVQALDFSRVATTQAHPSAPPLPQYAEQGADDNPFCCNVATKAPAGRSVAPAPAAPAAVNRPQPSAVLQRAASQKPGPAAPSAEPARSGAADVKALATCDVPLVAPARPAPVATDAQGSAPAAGAAEVQPMEADMPSPPAAPAGAQSAPPLAAPVTVPVPATTAPLNAAEVGPQPAAPPAVLPAAPPAPAADVNPLGPRPASRIPGPSLLGAMVMRTSFIKPQAPPPQQHPAAAVAPHQHSAAAAPQAVLPSQPQPLNGAPDQHVPHQQPAAAAPQAVVPSHPQSLGQGAADQGATHQGPALAPQAAVPSQAQLLTSACEQGAAQPATQPAQPLPPLPSAPQPPAVAAPSPAPAPMPTLWEVDPGMAQTLMKSAKESLLLETLQAMEVDTAPPTQSLFGLPLPAAISPAPAVMQQTVAATTPVPPFPAAAANLDEILAQLQQVDTTQGVVAQPQPTLFSAAGQYPASVLGSILPQLQTTPGAVAGVKTSTAASRRPAPASAARPRGTPATGGCELIGHQEYPPLTPDIERMYTQPPAQLQACVAPPAPVAGALLTQAPAVTAAGTEQPGSQQPSHHQAAPAQVPAALQALPRTVVLDLSQKHDSEAGGIAIGRVAPLIEAGALVPPPPAATSAVPPPPPMLEAQQDAQAAVLAHGDPQAAVLARRDAQAPAAAEQVVDAQLPQLTGQQPVLLVEHEQEVCGAGVDVHQVPELLQQEGQQKEQEDQQAQEQQPGQQPGEVADAPQPVLAEPQHLQPDQVPEDVFPEEPLQPAPAEPAAAAAAAGRAAKPAAHARPADSDQTQEGGGCCDDDEDEGEGDEVEHVGGAGGPAKRAGKAGQKHGGQEVEDDVSEEQQYLNALGLEDACSPAGPIDPKKVAARRAAAAEGLGGMGAQTAAAIARAASGGLQHATSAVNQQQRGMQGAAARKRKQLLQEFTISNAAQAGAPLPLSVAAAAEQAALTSGGGGPALGLLPPGASGSRAGASGSNKPNASGSRPPSSNQHQVQGIDQPLKSKQQVIQQQQSGKGPAVKAAPTVAAVAQPAERETAVTLAQQLQQPPEAAPAGAPAATKQAITAEGTMSPAAVPALEEAPSGAVTAPAPAADGVADMAVDCLEPGSIMPALQQPAVVVATDIPSKPEAMAVDEQSRDINIIAAETCADMPLIGVAAGAEAADAQAAVTLAMDTAKHVCREDAALHVCADNAAAPLSASAPTAETAAPPCPSPSVPIPPPLDPCHLLPVVESQQVQAEHLGQADVQQQSHSPKGEGEAGDHLNSHSLLVSNGLALVQELPVIADSSVLAPQAAPHPAEGSASLKEAVGPTAPLDQQDVTGAGIEAEATGAGQPATHMQPVVAEPGQAQVCHAPVQHQLVVAFAAEEDQDGCHHNPTDEGLFSPQGQVAATQVQLVVVEPALAQVCDAPVQQGLAVDTEQQGGGHHHLRDEGLLSPQGPGLPAPAVQEGFLTGHPGSDPAHGESDHPELPGSAATSPAPAVPLNAGGHPADEHDLVPGSALTSPAPAVPLNAGGHPADEHDLVPGSTLTSPAPAVHLGAGGHLAHDESHNPIVPGSAVTSPEPAVTTTHNKGADTATGTPLRNAMRAAQLAGTADGPLQRPDMGGAGHSSQEMVIAATAAAAAAAADDLVIAAVQQGCVPALQQNQASPLGASCAAVQDVIGDDLGIFCTQAQPDTPQAGAAGGDQPGPAAAGGLISPETGAAWQGGVPSPRQQQQEGQQSPLGAGAGAVAALPAALGHLPHSPLRTQASPAPGAPPAGAAACVAGAVAQTPGSSLNTRSRTRAGLSRFAPTPGTAADNGTSAAAAGGARDVAATPGSHRISTRSRGAGSQAPSLSPQLTGASEGLVGSQAARADAPGAGGKGTADPQHTQEGSGAAPSCGDVQGQNRCHPPAGLQISAAATAATGHDQGQDAGSPQAKAAPSSSGGSRAQTRSGQTSRSQRSGGRARSRQQQGAEAAGSEAGAGVLQGGLDTVPEEQGEVEQQMPGGGGVPSQEAVLGALVPPPPGGDDAGPVQAPVIPALVTFTESGAETKPEGFSTELAGPVQPLQAGTAAADGEHVTDQNPRPTPLPPPTSKNTTSRNKRGRSSPLREVTPNTREALRRKGLIPQEGPATRSQRSNSAFPVGSPLQLEDSYHVACKRSRSEKSAGNNNVGTTGTTAGDHQQQEPLQQQVGSSTGGVPASSGARPTASRASGARRQRSGRSQGQQPAAAAVAAAAPQPDIVAGTENEAESPATQQQQQQQQQPFPVQVEALAASRAAEDGPSSAAASLVAMTPASNRSGLIKTSQRLSSSKAKLSSRHNVRKFFPTPSPARRQPEGVAGAGAGVQAEDGPSAVPGGIAEEGAQPGGSPSPSPPPAPDAAGPAGATPGIAQHARGARTARASRLGRQTQQTGSVAGPTQQEGPSTAAAQGTPVPAAPEAQPFTDCLVAVMGSLNGKKAGGAGAQQVAGRQGQQGLLDDGGEPGTGRRTRRRVEARQQPTHQHQPLLQQVIAEEGDEEDAMMLAERLRRRQQSPVEAEQKSAPASMPHKRASRAAAAQEQHTAVHSSQQPATLLRVNGKLVVTAQDGTQTWHVKCQGCGDACQEDCRKCGWLRPAGVLAQHEVPQCQACQEQGSDSRCEACRVTATGLPLSEQGYVDRLEAARQLQGSFGCKRCRFTQHGCIQCRQHATGLEFRQDKEGWKQFLAARLRLLDQQQLLGQQEQEVGEGEEEEAAEGERLEEHSEEVEEEEGDVEDPPVPANPKHQKSRNKRRRSSGSGQEMGPSGRAKRRAPGGGDGKRASRSRQAAKAGNSRSRR